MKRGWGKSVPRECAKPGEHDGRLCVRVGSDAPLFLCEHHLREQVVAGTTDAASLIYAELPWKHPKSGGTA